MEVAVIIVGILIQVAYYSFGFPELYKTSRKILHTGTESNRRKQGYRRNTYLTDQSQIIQQTISKSSDKVFCRTC
jgi:hypothetical protein